MFNRYGYSILWIGLMILAGWGTWVAVMSQPDQEPEDRKPVNPDNEIGSISARTTRLEEIAPDGSIRWVLESVDLNGSVQGAFKMTQPKATIQLKNSTSIILTAPSGEYDNKSKEMILTGGVIVEKEDEQSTFWADEVFFSGDSKTIQSRGGEIKLSRGDWEFHAGNISIDMSSETTVINLGKPVRIVNYE